MSDAIDLMPDSLDPADAIVEGATEGVIRLLAFVVVTAGAAMLGLNLHEVPSHIATIRAGGIGSVLNVVQDFEPGSPILWFLMMLHSVVIWYLIPFVAVYFWLLIRLWTGSEMFVVLLTLTAVHSIHTFIYMQRQSPLAAGDL